METIILKMEVVDHSTIKLHTEKGATFTFDPNTNNGEALLDFLSS